MTVQKDNGKYISYLEGIWNQNKARGLTAQANFITEFETGTFAKHKGKLFHGCWFLGPKSIDYYKSMKYSQQNPHPDLKYIETRGQIVWYQCQKCHTYQHLEYFGGKCCNGCQSSKRSDK